MKMNPEASTGFFEKLPINEIVFICQVLVVYSIIIASIYNLSIGTNERELWIKLLSSAVGYLLPNPVLK